MRMDSALLCKFVDSKKYITRSLEWSPKLRTRVQMLLLKAFRFNVTTLMYGRGLRATGGSRDKVTTRWTQTFGGAFPTSHTVTSDIQEVHYNLNYKLIFIDKSLVGGLGLWRCELFTWRLIKNLTQQVHKQVWNSKSQSISRSFQPLATSDYLPLSN